MRKLFISGAISLLTIGFLLIGFVSPAFAASRDAGGTKPSQTAPHVVIPNAYRDSYYAPTLNGTWHGFTDDDGYSAAWTPSNGSSNTASAVWQFPGTNGDTSCQIWVYVPVGNATTSIGYAFYTTASGSGKAGGATINQNNISGWTEIGGTNGSNVQRVQFSNNDGQIGTQIGVGNTTFPSLEVYCPS